MKIGFIGTGRIAEACVRGLAGKGHDIYHRTLGPYLKTSGFNYS